LGQKTHPKGLRLGIVTDWDSKWFAEKEYSRFLHEDLKIQGFVKDRIKHAGISRVEIERYPDRRKVKIFTARPGIVIGRRGGEVDKLRLDLEKSIGHEVRLDIEEVKRPEIDAQLVSEGIALQLEKRVHLKKAMKKAVELAMHSGAEGIKIKCSGRIGGAEMARSEQEKQGRIPLHTLRADIDYGFSEAHTVAGKIGVKVWIFKGEKLSSPDVGAKIAQSARSDQRPTFESRERQTESIRGGESRDRETRERGQRGGRGSNSRGSNSRGSNSRGSRSRERGPRNKESNRESNKESES